MKLIDLLVKELPKRGGWPEGANESIEMHMDGDIFFDGDLAPEDFNLPLCSDGWETVLGMYSNEVTRDQYEAALAKNDGWIEWGGGECPVKSFSLVDLKFRNGVVEIGHNASAYHWENYNMHYDIIAYRLHKPDINSRTKDDRMEQDLNECIGQPVPPIEWTNSGLPLVGVKCEMADENGSYKPVEIIAWRNECVIGWDSERLITYISSNPSDFRQLRTEEGKAREKAIAELASVICGNVPDTGMATAAMYAQRVYDAGYRKEVK